MSSYFIITITGTILRMNLSGGQHGGQQDAYYYLNSDVPHDGRFSRAHPRIAPAEDYDW